MIILTLKEQLSFPLEAESLTPGIFLGKSTAEIANLPLLYGNQAAHFGDFFTVKGNGVAHIFIEGEGLARVKHIGTAMTQGRVTVHGDAGMHLGASMRGGEIDVHGNVGDWAGAEMTGGKIHITGNAGHGLGSAYRGSRHGMNRGMIIVEGNAGNEAGALMRRGLVVVLGDVGEFPGAFMIAGSIIVFGRIRGRPGAGMKRGTIVAYSPPELLPGFRYGCTYQAGFLQLILQSLRKHGVPVKDEQIGGNYRRYSGDFTTLGKGEILIYDQH
jgi:formylmethanofuran dehydrogenase subunit C